MKRSCKIRRETTMSTLRLTMEECTHSHQASWPSPLALLRGDAVVMAVYKQSGHNSSSCLQREGRVVPGEGAELSQGDTVGDGSTYKIWTYMQQ